MCVKSLVESRESIERLRVLGFSGGVASDYGSG
jgi:hypothetical protein